MPVAQGLEATARVSISSQVLGGGGRIHIEEGHGPHHYTKLPPAPLGWAGGIQSGSWKAIEEAPTARVRGEEGR